MKADRLLKVAVGAGVVLAGVMAPSAQAHSIRSEPTTAQAKPALAQIAAMSVTDQNRILNPLRAIANAADQAGKTTQSGIYSTLRIDAPDDVVDIYLTDVSKGAQFLRAAQRVDRHIDTRLAKVEKAPYTLRQLHAARAQLLAEQAAHKLPYTIYTAAVATDGSSLQLTVSNPGAARASAQVRGDTAANPAGQQSVVGGVPVTFASGRQLKADSWADTKWHDSTPFIGGDAIADGSYVCSAGLPTVRTSDNHPIMVTADHCFTSGESIYTGASPTPTMGDFYNTNGGYPGNYVGTVTGKSTEWDAEELDGSNNNSDESDSTTWHPVVGDAYSYNGDSVCQDGVASFFMQEGTVCGIQVINQDITYTLETDNQGSYTVRGVEGVRSAWAVAQGDSGAMVFQAGTTRQARGIVSAGSADAPTGGGHAGTYIYWTEAPDILGHFGLKMNPQT
ncbi:S1 family peptidase [Streptomyces canus]|uniref:peptidase n=1 Tax=Streptomyces canus TaxID=58343 RepID=UPI0022507DDF|nr:peptidase [Streptomyces canus]MCX5255137.1 S1 family peptidase [Streptomyces canus]